MGTDNIEYRGQGWRTAGGSATDAVRREAEFLRACREARQGRGWSQRELARQITAAGLRMHQSSIAKLEADGTHRRPISLAEAILLSQILAVPLAPYVAPGADDMEFERIAAEWRRFHEFARSFESWMAAAPVTPR